MKANKIIDITPQGRLISAEITKSIFNRSYFAFILVLLLSTCVIGYTMSQNKETQKDLEKVERLIETQTVYISVLTRKYENMLSQNRQEKKK